MIYYSGKKLKSKFLKYILKMDLIKYTNYTDNILSLYDFKNEFSETSNTRG
jgi:CRISPR/Cas system CMR-associated protein Cmr5 small subunit